MTFSLQNASNRVRFLVTLLSQDSFKNVLVMRIWTYVDLYAAHAYSAHRGQKRTAEPRNVGAGNEPGSSAKQVL